MYYFSIEQCESLIEKLKKENRKSFCLVGCTPVATGHADHQHEFSRASDLAQFLERFFTHVHVDEIDEGALFAAFHFLAFKPGYSF